MLIKDQAIFINHQVLSQWSHQLTLFCLEQGLIKPILQPQNFYQPVNFFTGSLLEIIIQNKVLINVDVLQTPQVMDYFKLCILENFKFLVSKTLPLQLAQASLFYKAHALINYLNYGDNLNSLMYYLMWEEDLLSCLGFNYDLSPCPLNNSMDFYCVSKKTGKFLSSAALSKYANQVFILPKFMLPKHRAQLITHGLNNTPQSCSDLLLGLQISSYFLQYCLGNYTNLGSIAIEEYIFWRSNLYNILK